MLHQQRSHAWFGIDPQPPFLTLAKTTLIFLSLLHHGETTVITTIAGCWLPKWYLVEARNMQTFWWKSLPRNVTNSAHAILSALGSKMAAEIFMTKNLRSTSFCYVCLQLDTRFSHLCPERNLFVCRLDKGYCKELMVWWPFVHSNRTKQQKTI